MSGPDPLAGRGASWRRYKPMAEINVTPFVDVMLVLLIIFMVTAPLLVAGVPVDLPDAKAKALGQDQTPIQIIIDKSGAVFIGKEPISREALGPRLVAMRDARRDDEARVYVRADSARDYGDVMAVVGEVNAAGFRRIALVTDQATPAAPAAGSAP
jgi:biopolymer transport protein TolR